MKELDKAIDACVNLKDELEVRSYNDVFGEKLRLLGAFLEDDFEDVIAAMEEARDRIEELEDEKEEMEKRIAQFESEAANAQ